MEWNKDWWRVDQNGEVVPSENAPKWLIREYKEYDRISTKMDSDNYIVDDRPRPSHPILERMSDEEIEEVSQILYGESR